MTHSAEAIEAFPENEFTQRATVLAFRDAFDAGRASVSPAVCTHQNKNYLRMMQQRDIYALAAGKVAGGLTAFLVGAKLFIQNHGPVYGALTTSHIDLLEELRTDLFSAHEKAEAIK